MKVISFVGTGNYQEVNYYFKDPGCSFRTRHFPEALMHIFSPEETLLFTTEEAFLANESLEGIPGVRVVPVPSGKDEDELWEIFEKISSHVEDGDSIVIDVTHGFRSQPIIALSVAVFLKTAKNVTIEKIVYGSFESRDPEGNVPVIDLTSFLQIIEWSFATELFIKYGNASLISNLLSDLHDSTQSQGSRYKARHLKNFAALLKSLTDSLSLVRPEQTAALAASLPEKLAEVRSCDLLHIKQAAPLEILLKRVPESFSNLSVSKGSLFSETGFRMQAEMIRFYLQTDQFPQAITLLRECLVSKVCTIFVLDPMDKNERAIAEEKLCEWNERRMNRACTDDQELQFAGLWSEVCNLRNDINHAGMRKEAINARALKKNILKVCHKGIELLYTE